MNKRNSLKKYIRRNMMIAKTKVYKSKPLKPDNNNNESEVHMDQLESANPFLDGTLANTSPKTNDVHDIFDDHLSVVKSARPKVKRYIPWSKIIMFSMVTIFLAGVIIGFIAIIFLLS